MYNFAKLSQGSQQFVGKLQAGPTVNVAVARAVAAILPLPTFAVENPEAQYKDTCAEAVNLLVSDIGEVTVLNFGEVVDLTRQLWLARYFTLNPLEHNYGKDGDAMACFMGFSHVISPAICKVVWDAGIELVSTVNGFAKVVREIQQLEKPGEVVSAREVAMLTPRVR